MSDSSPAPRRSPRQWSRSPDRNHDNELSAFLSENRNNELLHLEALAAAQAEHERVREAAIRAFQTHELKEQNRRLREQQERIREEQRKEEERIRNEERLRAEEERLRALRAKTVPKLPPEPEVAPSTSTLTSPVASSAFSSTTTTTTKQKEPQDQQQQPPPPQVNGSLAAKPAAQPPQTQPTQQPTQLPNPFQRVAQQQQQQQQQQQPPPQQNGFSAAPKPPQTSTAPAPTAPRAAATGPDRYVEIHQNLKKLRASLAEQAKSSPPLKQRLGNMRRELRKNLGQLVGEKGGNKTQIRAIQALLNESLSQVPSAPADPSQFITDPSRAPMEGAAHNDAKMPSLFLYLLNQLSKAIINQFIQECSGQPKSADPIGVVAALMFSNKAYCWRGKTLIDILMAKFRVACPVLFGYRGSEKTEQGRRRLGWRREGAGWVTEQLHISQMQGLGVGYASIALRDFALSANTSPWPPSRYWACLARIVNTPAAEISNTQCVVLRAMIEHYEDKFMAFYGTAAIAALRKALVEFPNKSQVKSQGAWGLLGLADVLKLTVGLEL